MRKERGRRNLDYFFTTYLSAHFELPFGEHLVDLCQVLQSDKKNKHIIRIIPKEHGKSTCMLVGYPIWLLAYELKWYLLILGASRGTIEQHFSTVQQILDPETGNDLLLRDFPHLQPMKDFKGQLVKWTDTAMKFINGAVMEGRSVHSKLRGLKQGKYRPDLIAIDDPQDEDEVSTHYRREKLLRRVRNTVLTMGSRYCDVLACGNFMHREGLLSTFLQDRKVWDGKLWMAENLPEIQRPRDVPIGNTKVDGSPLWPEAWPMERLMAKRDEIGNRSYTLEYRNKDISDEERTYDAQLFKYFDPVKFMESLPSDKTFRFRLYWDPASSPKKESRITDKDFASLTVGAWRTVKIDKKDVKLYWIVDNWMFRATTEMQCENCLRLVMKYPIERIDYEDNGGYGAAIPYLKKIAEEQDVALPQIHQFAQCKNKIQRILKAERIVKERMFFSNKLNRLFLDQWTEFPGTHDDGPDSCVGFLESIEKYAFFF